MAYSKEAQKRYSKKTKHLGLKYTPVDMIELDRLKMFLEVNGISANSYIKSLIKQDLDNKGIPYPKADNYKKWKQIIYWNSDILEYII